MSLLDFLSMTAADDSFFRAIWRGYKEIKDHGGWVCLVFAGMGIYRFCKYRIGFDPESMAILRRTRARFEVAADTLVCAIVS